MKFTITLVENDNSSYRCHVERTVENTQFEEWLVTAGKKEVVFRSNRPKLKNRKKPNWQVVSINFDIKDFKKASEWLCRLQDMIDERINPTPTFQQMRNKQ